MIAYLIDKRYCKVLCLLFFVQLETEKSLVGADNVASGIYAADVKGEGCTTVCETTRCTIKLNGQEEPHPNDQPGFTFVTFTFPTFTKIETKSFATFFAGNAGPLTNWINGLPDGTIILGCSRDDASTSMDAAAWNALASVGMDVENRMYRAGHALIGYKGSWPVNMTKSGSVAAGSIQVLYTFVLPPKDVLPIISGNYLEVKWKRRGTLFQNYFITASKSFGSDVGGMMKTVPATNESSVIGPLTHDIWYTLTMQVAILNNDTYRIARSDPFFIFINKAGNCSTGIYQFVLKIDGTKTTFDYGNSIWDDSSQLLNDKISFSGFDRWEAKPSTFNEFPIKKICAGMQDLTTNQFTFAEIQTTVKQPMKDFVSNRNGFPVLPSSTWNHLAPLGVPYAEHTCRQGFQISDQSRKAELGFLGSSKGGCSSINTKNVVIGFGISLAGTKCAAGSVFIDNSNTMVVKPAFGYLLIPNFVDSVWLEWSSWGGCNTTCGPGSRVRTRLSTIALGEGMQLPPFSNEVSSCKIVDCPPPPPTDVIVETVTRNQLLVRWTGIPASQMTNTLSHYVLEQWKKEDPAGSNTTSEVYSSVEKNVNNLDIFTVYCYHVFGVLRSGIAGNKSDVVCNSTDESVPIGSPGNITVFNSSSFCLNITWSPISVKQAQGIVTKYRIYYDLESGGDEQYIDVNSTDRCTICGLQPYTKYRVKISAFTSKGEGVQSSFSDPAYTDEYIPIEAPSITNKRKLNSTAIEVEWQPLALGKWRGVPLGYVIYCILYDDYFASRSNALFVQVSYPTVKFEITGLEKYKNYVIWMGAFTIKGYGIRNSTAVEQMTDEDVPLKGPLVKAYNTSSFSTRVEWDTLQEPYRLGVLTKYTVFYMNLKTHSNGSIDVSASVTSLDIDGLLPFNNHSFEVAAWTSKGMGSRGPVAFALTDEYVPMSWPGNFTGANLSSYELQLKWSDMPYDDWRGIPLGYTILYRETDAVGSAWNTSSVNGRIHLSTIIGGLTAYTNHTLRIAAFTIKGKGNFSEEIVIKTAEDAPYTSPMNISSVFVNETYAAFRWLQPERENVRGIIRHYKVTYQTVYTAEDFRSGLAVKLLRRRRAVISDEVIRQQINITVPADQYEVQLHNLQGYTNYSFQVLAITTKEGPLSDPIYVFTKETVPAMSPINVTAKASTYTSLMIKWKHLFPAYAHGAIKGYMVYYAYGNHSSANESEDSQVADKEFLEIAHLKIFAWYTIQVAAFTSVGIGVRSKSIHARTDEYYPIKAPDNVAAKSFILPNKIDVTWSPLPIQLWNGIPLGYNVVLTAHSVGGQKLKKGVVFSLSKKVAPNWTNCTFENTMAFYKYSYRVSSFTKVGDGPASESKYVDTCNVAKSVMSTSWIDSTPLVKHNPHSSTPDGFLPNILSGAVRHCSGLCVDLKVKNNATVNYQLDGQGKKSRKSSLDELLDSMTQHTDFVFPVMKPSFANDRFKFIELIKVDNVVLVEGTPLVNKIGANVSSSISSLFTVLTCFLMFCLTSGCIIWVMETWNRTGQMRIASFSGIFEGFYWAWVTATTVGYGDISPVSVAGKCFAMFWSLAGLILCGFLSGTLTSVLTASENPLAKPSAPKNGIGMVLDTWEISVAKRTGINVDENFTSYSELLDAVGNSSIKYGLIDSQVAKVWTPQLIKEKINVKRKIKLDGSLGVFAAGSARQLHVCFETYMKEEASKILTAMQITLQAETAKVARLLEVPANVTITMSPTKPAFYSWESVIMQAYIKVGALLFVIFIVLGLIYELIKHHRQRNAKIKIAPQIPRVAKTFPTRYDSQYGNEDGNSHETEWYTGVTVRPGSRDQAEACTVTPDDSAVTECPNATAKNDKLLLFDIADDPYRSTNELMTSESRANAKMHITSFIERPPSGKADRNSLVNSTQEPPGNFDRMNCTPTSSTNLGEASVSCRKVRSVSIPSDQQNLLNDSNDAEKGTGESRACGENSDDSNLFERKEFFSFDEIDPSCIPYEENILSYYGSDYYDNEALEIATEQSLAALEERFEALVMELTERHGSERENLQQIISKSEKKNYGNTYKFFDPKKFAAPW